MFDILFDIETREVIMQNGDFEITDNPSVQNGGNLLNSRCANIVKPMFGIGFDEVMNGDANRATFELNRWRQQAFADGATIAEWPKNDVSPVSLDFELHVSYE
jgi:hypothetical protein